MSDEKTKILTTSWGAPVSDNQNVLTAGPYGPLLLQDTHFIDKITHFDRERIPERVVHAKGAGAHGYFEVTADVTKYTKAKFLNKIGKRTPVFVRFSTVGGEKGSSDAARDPRGFAIKHHTEEGIYDMVGNNTPVFFIRDPSKFPDFIHTQKRNPQTNCGDANMFWDFFSRVPETVHQQMILFSDRGLPSTYRHMNGYSSHTFKWVNSQGDAFWVKLHYKTDVGVKNLINDEGDKLGNDHATKDLFDHIKSGKTATWTAHVQLMPVGDEKNYKWNIFDVTKVWPHKDYPLVEYGKLVLNRNPTNYFAEVEQSAFSPGHLVPGIEPSPDKMLQGRLFSYPDTHRHRLGPNYMQLPINAPYRSKVQNQQRDSIMTFENQGNEPNYEPSGYHTIKENKKYAIKKVYVNDWIGRYTQYDHPNSDFEQAGQLYSKVMNEGERTRLIKNIVGNLKDADDKIQARMVKNFKKVHEDYGSRVEKGLFEARKAKL